MISPEEAIRQRIQESGRITFAEFMSLALYGPGGYYTQGQPIGAGGDYYTSPKAHPGFGALLALQLEQIWRLLKEPGHFHVVEPGAGDGTLARDIVAFAQHLDAGFRAALTYIAVDANFRQRPCALPERIQWVQSSGFPIRNITGCVISNELVDALPVHRIGMRNGRLQELYVTVRAEGVGHGPPHYSSDRTLSLPSEGRLGVPTPGLGVFAEVWDDPSTPAIAQRLAEDEAKLQEGWEGEVHLAAAGWMANVAQGLQRGYVLTIDYGDTAGELFTAARAAGTVMSYYRHTPQDDPYSRIGRQDITAHANFTTLIRAARPFGLRPVTLMSQSEFLHHLGIYLLIEQASALPARARQANLAGLRDLVRSDGLGNFRVLLQGKNAPVAALGCLGKDGLYLHALGARLPSLPVPSQGAGHTDLLAGRFLEQQKAWIEGTWDELLKEDGR